MPVSKRPPEPTGRIVKTPAPDLEMRFSFKFFDGSDPELNPPRFEPTYTRALMERLRDLSSWTIRQFTGAPQKAIRNHAHDWGRTARPRGFTALNEQLRALQGWQFCLSANEHGRVHGIVIDHTFYVIWLDRDHKLYP
jgi:hypothetical protein